METDVPLEELLVYFNVLSVLFYVSLHLVTTSQLLNSAKFRGTAPFRPKGQLFRYTLMIEFGSRVNQDSYLSDRGQIARLSYDLEKSVRNLFHGPMFGKIQTKLLLIPVKEIPNMGSKQFDCPITLPHFK